MSRRQKSLGILIKSGRRIDPFAADVARILIEWFDSTTNMVGYLTLLKRVIQTAFYSLGTRTVSYLVFRVCDLCDEPSQSASISSQCLELFDAVIRYGVVPRRCLSHLVRCLCRRAGRDEVSWQIMRNLLSSECGSQSFVAMLAVLDKPARHRWVGGW